MKMMIVLVILFAMVSVTVEKTPSQDKRDYVQQDVLGTSCCRYLKLNGYLAKNANLKKLCFKTYHCKDILSKQSCKDVMAKNECLKDTTLSRMYCAFTCNRCGLHQCKSVPLGMQSKAIPDSKITASTYYSSGYKPFYGRLHMNSHGWIAKVRRIGQWLQVDLSKVTIVTGIATQGRHKTDNQWVKSYIVEYSLDGRSFHKYQAGKIFAANVDKTSVVKHDLNPPIKTRYIRLYPKTWNGWISMKMELYGCK